MKFLVFTLVFLATACALLLMPNIHFSERSSKIMHAAGFFCLSMSSFMTIQKIVAPKRRMVAFCGLLISLIIFSAFSEHLQAFIPGRFKDENDWIADLAGVFSAAFVSYCLMLFYDKKKLHSH